MPGALAPSRTLAKASRGPLPPVVAGFFCWGGQFGAINVLCDFQN